MEYGESVALLTFAAALKNERIIAAQTLLLSVAFCSCREHGTITISQSNEKGSQNLCRLFIFINRLIYMHEKRYDFI